MSSAKRLFAHHPAKKRNLPFWKQVGQGILILAIALGLVCRWVNLGEKPLWMDEGFTLLRASGYTADEAGTFASSGKIIRVEDFRRYQAPSPAKGIAGTIEGLALEEPQHPPLYFILTRFWQEIFGGSLASARALSALFGSLGIPVMYWLGWELFRDRKIAALATAFYSLSPLFVQLAQSARQYSLWLTLMMTATALLLQLLRQPQVRTGWLYGLTLAIGFYSHLLTGLVILGHGLYVLGHEFILNGKRQVTIAVKRWSLGILLAVGCAFPWLMLVWQNRDIARHTTHWLREPIPWPVLGQEWLSALGKGFIALHFNDAQLLTFGRIGVVGLILYAFYYFYTQSAPRIWLLISGLAGTAFLPFLAADLLWGGRRTLSDRYFMLCYVCIYLVVAFLLVSKMQAQRGSLLWRAVTLGLLTVSLVSATTGAFGTSWWGWSEYEREIPPIVQGVDRPLVVVSVEFFDSFRFAHQFQPKVDLLILDKSAYFTLPQDHENIFFYGPNPAFLAQLRALGLKLKPVYQFIDPSTKFTLEVYYAKLSDREIPQALAPSGQSKAQ